jgi:hypothetical protein
VFAAGLLNQERIQEDGTMTFNVHSTTDGRAFMASNIKQLIALLE